MQCRFSRGQTSKCLQFQHNLESYVILTLFYHLPTIYQPLTNHLPTIHRPLTDHLLTIHWPLTEHLLTTYRPPTDHLPTMDRPPTDHLLTTYWPLFYGAACSQLPHCILNRYKAFREEINKRADTFYFVSFHQVSLAPFKNYSDCTSTSWLKTPILLFSHQNKENRFNDPAPTSPTSAFTF